MGARAAGLAHAQAAQGQVDVVIDDQQVFQGTLVPLQKLRHALAGEVHEGLRLADHQAAALQGGFGQQAAALFPREAHPQAAGKHVGHFKAHVVPGVGVLQARVAQAHDETGFLFHGVSPKHVFAERQFTPLR